MRTVLCVVLIVTALIAPAPSAASDPVVNSPAQWVKAFWVAYTAKDAGRLETLFSPSAVIMGRSLAEELLRLTLWMGPRTELAVHPRGEMIIQEGTDWFTVRQSVALTYRGENGRPYRLLQAYHWELVSEDDSLRAIIMTVQNEPEPGLAVGEVRVGIHAWRAARPGEPKTTFARGEWICFVISGDVQGGRNFTLLVSWAPGEGRRFPPMFGYGPIDAPGPIMPMALCDRGFRPGQYIASVQVDGGPPRGAVRFAIAE